MSYLEMPEGCVCEEPGLCPVLDMMVGPHKHRLCRENAAARASMRGVGGIPPTLWADVGLSCTLQLHRSPAEHLVWHGSGGGVSLSMRVLSRDRCEIRLGDGEWLPARSWPMPLFEIEHEELEVSVIL